MKKSMNRVLLSALMVVMPLWTACERAEEISGITTETTFAAAPGKLKKVQVARANVTQTGVVCGWTNHGQSMTLTLPGGYRLEVARRAVRWPTQFCMEIVPGDMVKVKLTANDGTGEITNFHAPVKLTLPISALSSTDLADVDKLLFGNTADGTATIIDSAPALADAGTMTITGVLPHFSEWAVSVARDIIVGQE